MMMKLNIKIRAYWILGLLVVFWMGLMTIVYPKLDTAIAQSPVPVASAKKILRVATRIIPPFVMETEGKLTGFSIELWQKIAAEMGVESKITTYKTLPEMIDPVEENKVDLAIAAISITAEREARFDFSYPIFNSQLQILVRNPKKVGMLPNLLRDLFSPTLLQLIGLALLMVVIAAHIIWLFERRHPNSPITESYFPGIFIAAWWAASTLATQAEEMPKGALGRIMAVLWMFVAVLFVAYFTATVTTGMTVQSLQGGIQGLDDLKGRSVVTVAKSTAADFLKSKSMKVLTVGKIETAYEDLLTEKVDAIIFDSPVLRYYVAHEGNGLVQIVGESLRDESYGIALPDNSPYRKAINSALLNLRENGSYQQLYDRWFKVKSDS